MGRTPIPNPYRKRNPRDIEDRVRRLEKQYKRDDVRFDGKMILAAYLTILALAVVIGLLAGLVAWLGGWGGARVGCCASAHVVRRGRPGRQVREVGGPVTNRGTVILKRWEENLIAEREAVVVTERCRFCQLTGKEWSVEGPVGETRAAYLAHRLEHHPEVQPRPRRQRKRPGGQISTGRNIDDNIANARKTGAAGWAGAL